MKKTIFFFCFISSVLWLQAQSLNPLYLDYINKYRDMAIEQQRKHKVPAAITMAQGILESAAGTSELATQANNHFGIKCTSDWVGRTITKDDDNTDYCICTWTPKWTGKFTIKVVNRGGVYNVYDLETN